MKLKLFFASWCGPCKLLKPILYNLQNTYPNLEIEEYDVDEFSELVKEYKIKSVPTIIFENGFKTEGLLSEEKLKNIINEIHFSI